MTCLIVIFTAVFSFLNPLKTHNFYELAKIHHKYKTKKYAVNLFMNYCTAKSNKSKHCKNFSPLISEKFIQLPKNFNQRNKNHRDKFEKIYLKKYRANNKLKVKLTTAEKGHPFYNINKDVRDFYKNRFKPEKKYSSTPGYALYKNAISALLSDIKAKHIKTNALSLLNLNFDSLMSAQLRHADFFHLFTNLLALIFFGIYLEQRIGMTIFGLIYFIGGSLSVYTHTLFGGDPTIPLVGASGNVSVILGAFWILFFKSNMRLFIPFITAEDKIYTPISTTIPFLMLFADIVGVISSQNIFNTSSHIGHIAHLSGFLFGVFIGLLFNVINPLRWPFRTNKEIQDFKKMQAETNLEKKIQLAHVMLEENHENFCIPIHMIEYLCLNHRHNRTYFSQNENDFIYKNLSKICTAGIEKGDFEALLRLIKLLPNYFRLSYFLCNLNQKEILVLADYALFRNETILAIRLYEAYLQIFKDSRFVQNVFLSTKSLLLKIPTKYFKEELHLLLENSENPLVSEIVEQKLQESDEYSFTFKNVPAG